MAAMYREPQAVPAPQPQVSWRAAANKARTVRLMGNEAARRRFESLRADRHRSGLILGLSHHGTTGSRFAKRGLRSVARGPDIDVKPSDPQPLDKWLHIRCWARFRLSRF